MKKDKGTWQMTAPLAVKADATEIGSITTNLGTLEITRVVDENPADLKEYGLDAPRVEIEFKASGDKTYGDYHRLLLGGKSPTGGDVFAMRDADKRVILVPGIPIRSSTARPSTCATRRCWSSIGRRSTGSPLRPMASGNTVEFAKDATGWKLTKPMAAIADPSAADTLLGRVQGAAMKSIVAEQATPADLKKYGFDKPQATLTLHAGGGVHVARLRWQRQRHRSFRARRVEAARRHRRPFAPRGTAESSRGISPEELFGFSRYSTDRLEFTRDGQTVVLEKVKSQDLTPDKWRRVSPTAGEPDAMNVDDLLTKLEGLRATSFLNSTAGTGLDKPSLTVYAKFENGTKEDRVSFGRSSRRRARRDSRPARRRAGVRG